MFWNSCETSLSVECVSHLASCIVHGGHYARDILSVVANSHGRIAIPMPSTVQRACPWRRLVEIYTLLVRRALCRSISTRIYPYSFARNHRLSNLKRHIACEFMMHQLLLKYRKKLQSLRKVQKIRSPPGYTRN